MHGVPVAPSQERNRTAAGASSLLGDPDVLLFDEPFNGLDLDGVRWNRALLRGFADEGHTRAARRLGRAHRTG